MKAVETLIAEARAKKFRIANLYEGTDSVWRCFLYRRVNQVSTEWPSGYGATPAEAISSAITTAEAPKAKPANDRFEELL